MNYKCQISTIVEWVHMSGNPTLEWVSNVKWVKQLNELQMSNKHNTGMSSKCQKVQLLNEWQMSNKLHCWMRYECLIRMILEWVQISENSTLEWMNGHIETWWLPIMAHDC
jgi:hypothetical protein